MFSLNFLESHSEAYITVLVGVENFTISQYAGRSGVDIGLVITPWGCECGYSPVS